jgi:hypothetical protein
MKWREKWCYLRPYISVYSAACWCCKAVFCSALVGAAARILRESGGAPLCSSFWLNSWASKSHGLDGLKGFKVAMRYSVLLNRGWVTLKDPVSSLVKADNADCESLVKLLRRRRHVPLPLASADSVVECGRSNECHGLGSKAAGKPPIESKWGLFQHRWVSKYPNIKIVVQDRRSDFFLVLASIFNHRYT